ncbi:MAG: hypothetical protein NTX64_10350 [Elusimicrobia bacterium]|nr:hypothetical protein [Elusimicrobiota bacterium]
MPPPPAPEPSAKVYHSPDGTRNVIVSGDEQKAYLYDTAPAPAFSPVYLGSSVNDVQFQLDNSGKLDGIVTVLDDGALNMFDPNGKPVGQVVYSPDRTRKVEISGDDRVAYLYDASPTPAFGAVYLGTTVAGVQFQTDESGRLVILTLNEDGSSNTYDANGVLIDSQPAPQQLGQASSAQKDGSQGIISATSLEKSASFKTLSSENVGW